MFAYNHKRKKKDTILREMYSDTLDMDISFDVPVCLPALFSRETFGVPVRPKDAKGLILMIFHYFIKFYIKFIIIIIFSGVYVPSVFHI